MKKNILIIILLLLSLALFAQGEANNWFFGQFAGIKFNADGTVEPISGSLATTEGCSSISNAAGELLFYTDGRNVWDRNHVIMPNGNYNANPNFGLMGDPSSTQSAIIVPKKGEPNIYYIFTVDEPHHQNADVYPNQFTGIYNEQGNNGTVPTADDGFNNGLNFSVVDLSIVGSNGSIGDITTRNVQLLTYDPSNPNEAKYKCSEKITAVKTANGLGYWVITHFIDKFYAFKVDGTGVNTTPVITQIDPVVTQDGYRRNSIGYLKVSPDGRKLAVAHQQRGISPGSATTNGAVYLYDFDAATGIVSNAVQIRGNLNPYGIEFSPETKMLYVTYGGTSGGGGLRQYNLTADNIAASEILISSSAVQSGALQLGPNGKIYHASNGTVFLDVIHSPEESGAGCNFQQNGQIVTLDGSGITTLGLPPFITSVFSAQIITNNACLGQTATFELNVNQDFDTVSWDFGDGSAASSDINPVHVYTAAGTYNVVATITKDGESSQVSASVQVTAVPVANIAPALTQCVASGNTATFDLNVNKPAILGSQDAQQFDIKYYTTQDNANADTNAITAGNFTNTSNPQTIYSRIYSKANTSCFATTSFQIAVSNTPAFTGTAFALCDDATDGDDSNGRVTFNLDTVTQALVQNNTAYTTTYYATPDDAIAESGPLPVSFYNTVPNEQVVYARVANISLPACFKIEPITLKINALPPAVTGASLVQCDLALSPDGLTQFRLSEANAQFTAGNQNLSVTYFPSVAAAEIGTGLLPDSFNNTVNPQQIYALLTNTQTGCSRILPLTLTVTGNTTAPITLELCDDATEDGFTKFDLRVAGLEDGSNTVVYYASPNDALLEQNPIAADYTNTTPNQQNVYARVEVNNACTTLQEIKLIVRPLPDIATTGEGIVCLNTGNPITLTPGILTNNPNFAFIWSTGATTRNIQVNQPGIYTVRVIDTGSISRCEKTRTITVTASDVAVITDVDIVDLTGGPNTVTVHVQPGNNVNTTYQYSLDLPNGPYQDSNYFEDVSAGIHTVYVYDTKGCGVVYKDIAVLSIPKFFTPNNDGTNDTWNIIGVNALFYSNSKIYIFDRFGKLLANVNPRGQGWNGIYNGHNLPATDYWYVLELDNGRTVKGHFSLMR